MPFEYLILRKLKLWAGNGAIPFPEWGGYMDQPNWLVNCIEACIKAEKEVNMASPQPQKAANELLGFLGEIE